MDGMDETKKAAPAAKENHMPENQEQLEKLQKALDTANAAAAEEKAKREAVEKEQKDQATTIAALQKRLDDAEDEKRLAGFRKMAEGFASLPIKADAFAPVLKKAAGAMSAEEFAELTRVLKAGNAAMAANFEEIGAPGHESAPESATVALEKKAREYMKDEKLSYGDAFAKACAENPALDKRRRRESYASASEKEE